MFVPPGHQKISGMIAFPAAGPSQEKMDSVTKEITHDGVKRLLFDLVVLLHWHPKGKPPQTPDDLHMQMCSSHASYDKAQLDLLLALTEGTFPLLLTTYIKTGLRIPDGVWVKTRQGKFVRRRKFTLMRLAFVSNCTELLDFTLRHSHTQLYIYTDDAAWFKYAVLMADDLSFLERVIDSGSRRGLYNLAHTNRLDEFADIDPERYLMLIETMLSRYEDMHWMLNSIRNVLESCSVRKRWDQLEKWINLFVEDKERLADVAGAVSRSWGLSTIFYQKLLEFCPTFFNDKQHTPANKLYCVIEKSNRASTKLLLDSFDEITTRCIYYATNNENFIMDIVLERRKQFAEKEQIEPWDVSCGQYLSNAAENWRDSLRHEDVTPIKQYRRSMLRCMETLLEHGFVFSKAGMEQFADKMFVGNTSHRMTYKSKRDELYQFVQMLLSYGQDWEPLRGQIAKFYRESAEMSWIEPFPGAQQMVETMVSAYVNFHMLKEGTHMPKHVHKAIKEYRYITNLSNKTKLELPLELCSRIEGHLFRLNTHRDRGRQWDAFQRELWSHGDKILHKDKEAFIEDKYRQLCGAPTHRSWTHLKKRTRDNNTTTQRSNVESQTLEQTEEESGRKRQRT